MKHLKPGWFQFQIRVNFKLIFSVHKKNETQSGPMDDCIIKEPIQRTTDFQSPTHLEIFDFLIPIMNQTDQKFKAKQK